MAPRDNGPAVGDGQRPRAFLAHKKFACAGPLRAGAGDGGRAAGAGHPAEGARDVADQPAGGDVERARAVDADEEVAAVGPLRAGAGDSGRAVPVGVVSDDARNVAELPEVGDCQCAGAREGDRKIVGVGPLRSGARDTDRADRSGLIGDDGAEGEVRAVGDDLAAVGDVERGVAGVTDPKVGGGQAGSGAVDRWPRRSIRTRKP